MTTGSPSVCNACALLDRSRELTKEPTAKSTCTAFPRGIPGEIRHGGRDHRVPIRGDHGITFELKAGEEKTLEQYDQYWSAP